MCVTHLYFYRDLLAAASMRVEEIGMLEADRDKVLGSKHPPCHG